VAHIGVAVADSKMKEDDSMGSWGELYIICFFFELLWDFLLVHLVVIVMVKKGS
jgi:hypothetical protein